MKMDTDGRPPMERLKLTEGQWVGPYYVVMARGGHLEVIRQCLHWTPQEIHEAGQRRRTEARRKRNFDRRLRENLLDDDPPDGQE